MQRYDVSRRRVLGRAATAGIAGIAGCLDRLPFLGGGFEPTKWMYHREAVHSSLEYYYAGLARPAEIPDVGDVAGFYDYFTHANLFGEFAGVDWRSATGAAAFRQSNVLRTEYDRSIAIGTLTGEEPEFEAAGTYRGYDVYENETVGLAVGLDGDVLVAGHGLPDLEPTEALETTVDTREGEVPRVVDEDEAASRLLDRIADDDVADVTVWPASPFEEDDPDALVGCTGWAHGFEIEEETTDVRHHYVYEDADQIDEDAFRRMIENSEKEGIYEVRDRSLSTDGRVLTVSGTTDTESLGPPFAQ